MNYLHYRYKNKGNAETKPKSVEKKNELLITNMKLKVMPKQNQKV